MGRKIATAEIIERCKKVHGEKYDYSKTEYVSSKTPLAIECKKHGTFHQLLCNHLKGCGCPSCGGNKRITTEEYVNRLKKSCNNENIVFDKIKYVNNHTPITLVCKMHGEWQTLPSSLLNNIECPNCQKERLHNMFALTTDEFIEKARAIHCDIYDYSKSEYVDYDTKICIICKKHGEFWQSPSTHLSEKGCPKCGQDRMWDKRGRMTTSKLIDKLIAIHGTEYDYSKVNYISPKHDIEIICPKHGLFFQKPYSHLNGCGCPKCGLDKLSKRFSKTTEEYIEEAKKVHGNEFDYSNLVYRNCRTKVEIICRKHGSFLQSPTSHLKGVKCPMCYAELSTSNNEIEFQNYIKELCDDDKIRLNARNIINPLELDVVNETMKIAIEYNGLYWHSSAKLKDRNYHLNKTKLCRDNGYRLIHIFEDEWINKREIVKSYLEKIFDKNQTIVNGYNTEIKQIDKDLYCRFLEENYINGANDAEIRYGLFHNNSLVSLIGLNNILNNEYELVCLSDKKNISINKSHEKLLNEFINDFKPSKLVVYADIRLSDGSEFMKLGLSHIGDIEPSFYYTNGRVRIKNNGEDEIKLGKYHKIYDCGKMIFSKFF